YVQMTVSRLARCSTSGTRFMRAALVAALCWSSVVYAQPIGLPTMGSASSAELSPSLERTLGDAIMEQGRRDPTYISDPDVSQYLTAMGRKLAAHAPASIG